LNIRILFEIGTDALSLVMRKGHIEVTDLMYEKLKVNTTE